MKIDALPININLVNTGFNSKINYSWSICECLSKRWKIINLLLIFIEIINGRTLEFTAGEQGITQISWRQNDHKKLAIGTGIKFGIVQVWECSKLTSKRLKVKLIKLIYSYIFGWRTRLQSLTLKLCYNSEWFIEFI